MSEIIDYKALEATNKLINEWMGREPKISYAVATDDAICFDASHFTDHPASQKLDCDKWLAENKARYPDGWVAKGGYETRKFESYPHYHSDWNELMKVVEKVEASKNSDGYGHQVVMQNNICRIEAANIISDKPYIYGKTKIDATYKAITDFINAYIIKNETNNTNSTTC
jgi:hypothetical protein